MQSYWVTNLLIPGDPVRLTISAPSGSWTLEQTPDFTRMRTAIVGSGLHRRELLPVAETYFLENEVGPHSGAASADAAFEEVTPILLGATYAIGLSVTVERSTAGSEIAIMTPSAHWPRSRAVSCSSPVVNSASEFQHLVERFIQAWPTTARAEKALLLIHHWIDAMACWSLEDLYLSTTTLLQIIVATEATKQGKNKLDFFPGLTDAAHRANLHPLGPTFKDMRNELIHDGRLIGSRFAGPDQLACAAVAADVLNWIDGYLHFTLNLGAVARKRFTASDFMSLNAYSI